MNAIFGIKIMNFIEIIKMFQLEHPLCKCIKYKTWTMKNWVAYSKQFLHKSRECSLQMCLLHLLQVALVFLSFLAEHNAHLFCFAAEAGAISLVWALLAEVEGILVVGCRASNVFKTLEMFWLIVFWSVDTQDRL